MPMQQQQQYNPQQQMNQMQYRPGVGGVPMRTMVVGIPPGARPGSTLQLTSPDGKLMQIQLPMNFHPGMQIQVPY